MKTDRSDRNILESTSATPAFLSGSKRAVKLMVLTSFVVALSGCETPGRLAAANSSDESRPEHYDAMVVRFASLREEDPGNLNAVVGLARYLRYDGRTTEAIDVLESEHEAFADDPGFLTELGAAYLTQGRTSDSKEILERSLKLGPNSWRTYATLGIANDLLHEYDEAAAAYTKALEFCPRSSSIHNNLGLSAGSIGDRDVAISHLSKARDLDPENVIIKNNLTFFQQDRPSCQNCLRRESREMIKAIHSQDSKVDGKAVNCSNDLTSAQEIVASLVDTSSIDMRVHFAFDSAVLLPEGEEALDELAEAMMSEEMRDDAFVLEGHTDAVGSHSYNQRLSERRAAAVRQYLMRSGGVQSSRLSTVGYGESRLLDPADPQSGVNRRVRVVRADS